LSRTLPLPLPPSGISVWRPLSSSEGGLVAIVGSGPSGAAHSSEEDVQCVWCGLRSTPAPVCDVCGSPLYDSISIWQPASPPVIERAPAPAITRPAATASAVTPGGERSITFWPAMAPAIPAETPPAESEPAEPPEPAPLAAPEPAPEPAPGSSFKAFKRFAGLEIRWIHRADH
jgi:hypothetical protein